MRRLPQGVGGLPTLAVFRGSAIVWFPTFRPFHGSHTARKVGRRYLRFLRVFLAFINCPFLFRRGIVPPTSLLD